MGIKGWKLIAEVFLIVDKVKTMLRMSKLKKQKKDEKK